MRPDFEKRYNIFSTKKLRFTVILYYENYDQTTTYSNEKAA